MTALPRVDRALEAAAPALLGYFLRRTDDPHDAAALLNETLFTAWRAAGRMPKDEERARMWLFGIARNTLRHHERGQRRRTAAVLELSKVIAAAPRLLADDDAVGVRDAVASLPTELAELIRLVHWDGFSVEQAAALLRIPASTARSRHARAKALLRAALADEPDWAAPKAALMDGVRP
ncbi:RNA polymerase sigma factor [Agrococcus sp. ARC_14]|uniref:RNA polymerase sigma factor n=1 Tax=Agrococcus sp. ARC_14 TaxID=2919927 RepID=UPI001F06C1AF|nr:RNA polymerase sigma factor [Agrococcus sp. ARC_14]MCH1883359.1 RNA polymerase sigma factor [Agrococcus sp. ARC_14]